MRASTKPIVPPFICPRCLKHQRRAYTSSTSTTAKQLSTLPAPPPGSGAAKITTRRLIHVHGQDAPKFLQGIISNNLRADSRTPFYAAFLTAQGKVLHDVFVYPTAGSAWAAAAAAAKNAQSDEPGYLVEVDGAQSTALVTHIKRHKLRAKLGIRLLDAGELDVWSAWREEDKWTAHAGSFGSGGGGGDMATNGEDRSSNTSVGLLGLIDRRASGLGQRVLLPGASSGHESPLHSHPSLESLSEAPLSAYTIRRYLRGVAEGQAEIPRDNSFPMNVNIDLMGGIDFKKGCYIGQELTIRTHHTGVVRRRILPVMLFDSAGAVPDRLDYDASSAISMPAQDAEMKLQGKRGRPGKWIAGVGNVGLAMCRLEMMTDLVVTAEPSQFSPEERFVINAGSDETSEEVGVRAFVPDWVRGKIRAPKAQKRVE